MGKRTRVLLFCIAIFAAFAAIPSVGLADDAPTWLKQAATAKPATYQKEVTGVVLVHDKIVTFNGNGKLTSTENWAVRILSRDAKKLAIARAEYLANFSSVRELKAWIIRPDGSVKEYDKKNLIDVISDPNDVYNELRRKVIDASYDVEAGYVFGFTAVTDDSPLFFEDEWFFQDRRLPVFSSTYSLTLPSGWTASSLTFNAPEVKPQVNGSTYTWTMRDLPYVPDEPMGPSLVHLVPRIAVNYSPDNRTQVADKAFAVWADVSRFQSTLYDPQVIVDDNVAAKARELTVNAATELDKIRAIGAFVQSIQYIAIDIGVGYGNGMRPRSSALVLNRGYGDCKDKANLMRAMLRSLKIDAYPVIIYSGDPRYVRAEWVSPGQFNHCIIAVRVNDRTNAPTVIVHEKLGRLLIFDATDEHTPVGDLPDHEQGSYALVVAGADGGLVKMPVIPADLNRVEREAEVTVSTTGAVSGKIMQKTIGQESTWQRTLHRQLTATEYKSFLEQWLSGRVAGSTLTKFETVDRKADARFDLAMEFNAPTYAQIMQNRLMMFKPAMVGRLDQFMPVDGKRITPMVIDASSYAETIKIKLPAGFVIDEIPEGGKFESDFGVYTSKYEVVNDVLHFSRSLILKRALVPAADYHSVDKFFGIVRGSEASPVVLIRK